MTDVAPDGPAAKAGIKAGDVVLEVGGSAIDQDGNYDEPMYGRIALVNLVTSRFAGDKLPLKISREGQTQTLEATVSHEPVGKYVSEPYVIDRAPRYYVVDGLIFEELSRQYLKEWGGDWAKQAPQRLVYLDRYQSEVIPEGRKRIVILSQVLPTASNIGYEDLKYLVVTNINGTPINSLDDLSAALGKPENGFDKVQFEDFPKEIFLDAKNLEQNDKDVIESYSLPGVQRLD